MHFEQDLNTAFGLVRMAYTGGGHVCVFTNHETGPIEVRKGSPLSLNAHLYRNEQGVFVINERETTLAKVNSKRFSDREAPRTFRNKVSDVITRAVNATLPAFSSEMAAEDVAEIERAIERTQRGIDDLETKMAPLREERARLETRLVEAKSVLRPLL